MGFESGEFHADTIDNVDKTIFVWKAENEKLLALIGDLEVQYADTLGEYPSMILMVRIKGENPDNLSLNIGFLNQE